MLGSNTINCCLLKFVSIYFRLKNLLVADNLDDYINVSIISDHDTENNIKMELKSGKCVWYLVAKCDLKKCCHMLIKNA